MPHQSAIRGFQFRRCREVWRGVLSFIPTLAVIFSAATSLLSQTVQHLSTTQPGGMPGLAVMGGIEQLTNGVRIHWDGPSGYYQVFQQSNSLSAPWAALGKATNLVRYAVITRLYSNAFFRVSGPAPKYAGAKVCVTCHSGICQYETKTPHASAFSSTAFKASGGQTNASCLPCHTVGYGLPTGFVSATATTLHRPGCSAKTATARRPITPAAPDDPTAVPRVEIAATVCGGCHTASQPLHKADLRGMELQRTRLRDAGGAASHEFIHQ